MGEVLMRRLAVILAGLLVPAFLLTGAIVHPALAQDQAKAKTLPEPVVKVLAENDRVRVQESTYKPGSGQSIRERPLAVIRVLKGGTMLRTFPDGKTETIRLKDGQTIIREAVSYGNKNIGKTTIHLYIVQLKK
jgi:hypothetical protein